MQHVLNNDDLQEIKYNMDVLLLYFTVMNGKGELTKLV